MAKEDYFMEDDDDITFNLLNMDTINRLRRDGKIEVPKKKVDVPKDKKWNEKQMASKILQGILSGSSVDDMADAMKTVIGNNQASAIRNTRTMVTSAENHGRMDSYNNLASKGVVMKKEWIATPDDRTRPTHVAIDGEQQDLNKPFSNGCMFPGDAKGPSEEVWMCRCAMGTHIVGFLRADGSVSKVQYGRDETLHDRQMAEEKARRLLKESFSIDLSNVKLPEIVIDSAVEYGEKMSQDDIKKFNEIFKNAEYIESENGSYYDPTSNEVYISQSEASNTTAFHESTHWYDFNQNYTITEDYGKYKRVTDENGDLTGEKKWVSDIVTIKENAGFSEYIAHNWDRYERGEDYTLMQKDMANFVKKVGTSDTYGWGRDISLVEQDMKAIRTYLDSMGVSRTDLDYIHLSDFISAISYDANLGSLATGGHSYDYWVKSNVNRVTEITAGYNLLRATGREDLIAVERDLAPNLMKLIETEWAKIW